MVTIGEAVTYGELDILVGRIAAGLAELPHGDRPIALLMREGPLLFATMLAAAKANRIFIPLEVTSAENWLARVVATCGAAFVISDRSGLETATRIAGAHAAVLSGDTLAASDRAPLPQSLAGPHDMACVLYTSGSTGQPKGVVFDHEFILQGMRVRGARYGYRPGDRFGHLRSSGYSGGFHNGMAALLSGAGVYVFDLRAEGMHRMASWLNAQAITQLAITGSLFRTWLATLPEDYLFPILRVLQVSAEPVYGSDLARMAKHLTGEWRVLHGLSSTEMGVVAQASFGPASSVAQGALPVGTPVPGVSIRLEDESGQQVPVGEEGEIVVRGHYMARGYWNDPDLTATKFITESDGRRLYYTRDLGRFHADGTLEHLGRKDRKIKLRGYSVEPHEVECALLRLPDIRDAAVIVEGTGDDAHLLAFVSGPKNVFAANIKDIRLALVRDLPPQLVPTDIFVLPALPLTPRGKVDRQALLQYRETPKREASRPPSTDIERMLLDIWQKTLSRKDFGVDENFLDLGATSLQIFSVFSWLDALGWNLPPSMIFEAPTIAQQAVHLSNYVMPQTASRILVRFRESGDKPPLFFVHALKGDILYARELFPNLKGDRPYYGLRPPPLDGKSRIPRAVEEIAAGYITDMKSVQPNGPYHLCGYSFGGTVVFEIAHQLSASGDEIAFLGLIDTTFETRERIGGRRKRSTTPSLGKMRKILAALWSIGVYISYWQDEIRLLLRSSVLYERRLAFYNYIYLRASHRYRRQPYGGHIVFFSRLGRAERHRAQWARVALGGLDVHEIPGDHGEIVWPPVNALLAKALDASLTISDNSVGTR